MGPKRPVAPTAKPAARPAARPAKFEESLLSPIYGLISSKNNQLALDNLDALEQHYGPQTIVYIIRFYILASMHASHDELQAVNTVICQLQPIRHHHFDMWLLGCQISNMYTDFFQCMSNVIEKIPGNISIYQQFIKCGIFAALSPTNTIPDIWSQLHKACMKLYTLTKDFQFITWTTSLIILEKRVSTRIQYLKHTLEENENEEKEKEQEVDVSAEGIDHEVDSEMKLYADIKDLYLKQFPTLSQPMLSTDVDTNTNTTTVENTTQDHPDTNHDINSKNTQFPIQSEDLKLYLDFLQLEFQYKKRQSMTQQSTTQQNKSNSSLLCNRSKFTNECVSMLTSPAGEHLQLVDIEEYTTLHIQYLLESGDLAGALVVCKSKLEKKDDNWLWFSTYSYLYILTRLLHVYITLEKLHLYHLDQVDQVDVVKKKLYLFFNTIVPSMTVLSVRNQFISTILSQLIQENVSLILPTCTIHLSRQLSTLDKSNDTDIIVYNECYETHISTIDAKSPHERIEDQAQWLNMEIQILDTLYFNLDKSVNIPSTPIVQRAASLARVEIFRVIFANYVSANQGTFVDSETFTLFYKHWITTSLPRSLLLDIKDSTADVTDATDATGVNDTISESKVGTTPQVVFLSSILRYFLRYGSKPCFYEDIELTLSTCLTLWPQNCKTSEITSISMINSAIQVSEKDFGYLSQSNSSQNALQNSKTVHPLLAMSYILHTYLSQQKDIHEDLSSDDKSDDKSNDKSDDKSENTIITSSPIYNELGIRLLISLSFLDRHLEISNYNLLRCNFETLPSFLPPKISSDELEHLTIAANTANVPNTRDIDELSISLTLFSIYNNFESTQSHEVMNRQVERNLEVLTRKQNHLELPIDKKKLYIKSDAADSLLVLASNIYFEIFRKYDMILATSSSASTSHSAIKILLRNLLTIAIITLEHGIYSARPYDSNINLEQANYIFLILLLRLYSHPLIGNITRICEIADSVGMKEIQFETISHLLLPELQRWNSYDVNITALDANILFNGAPPSFPISNSQKGMRPYFTKAIQHSYKFSESSSENIVESLFRNKFTQLYDLDDFNTRIKSSTTQLYYLSTLLFHEFENANTVQQDSTKLYNVTTFMKPTGRFQNIISPILYQLAFEPLLLQSQKEKEKKKEKEKESQKQKQKDMKKTDKVENIEKVDNKTLQQSSTSRSGLSPFKMFYNLLCDSKITPHNHDYTITKECRSSEKILDYFYNAGNTINTLQDSSNSSSVSSGDINLPAYSAYHSDINIVRGSMYPSSYSPLQPHRTLVLDLDSSVQFSNSYFKAPTSLLNTIAMNMYWIPRLYTGIFTSDNMNADLVDESEQIEQIDEVNECITFMKHAFGCTDSDSDPESNISLNIQEDDYLTSESTMKVVYRYLLSCVELYKYKKSSTPSTASDSQTTEYMTALNKVMTNGMEILQKLIILAFPTTEVENLFPDSILNMNHQKISQYMRLQNTSENQGSTSTKPTTTASATTTGPKKIQAKPGRGKLPTKPLPKPIIKNATPSTTATTVSTLDAANIADSINSVVSIAKEYQANTLQTEYLIPLQYFISHVLRILTAIMRHQNMNLGIVMPQLPLNTDNTDNAANTDHENNEDNHSNTTTIFSKFINTIVCYSIFQDHLNLTGTTDKFVMQGDYIDFNTVSTSIQPEGEGQCEQQISKNELELRTLFSNCQGRFSLDMMEKLDTHLKSSWNVMIKSQAIHTKSVASTLSSICV